MAVLAQKWRPQTFDEVVGQPHVTQALKNGLSQNHLHNAYLFTGTRGIGKTTLARILAKALNCHDGITSTPCGHCSACQEITQGSFVDLLEVDAASRTKVEETRELINNVQYAPTKGRFKVYLIDEVHMLSDHSFNALLKTFEEPPPHVKFLLATTDPQKLPATILSRCLQFHLTPITIEEITLQLEKILKDENISYDKAALLLLAEAAQGSMRDALTLLDQGISYGRSQIKVDEMKSMLGLVDSQLIEQLLQAVIDQNIHQLFTLTETLYHQGGSLNKAFDGLLTLLQEIAIEQISPSTNHPFLKKLAAQISEEEVQIFYEVLIRGKASLDLSPTPEVGFKMTMIRLLGFSPNHLVKEQAQKSSMIEKINKKESIKKLPIEQKEHLPPSDSLALASPAKYWATLLPTLKLTGITHTLAYHARCISFENDRLHLAIEAKQKPLLQPRYVDRIKAALKKLYHRPIHVEISVMNNPVKETPHLQAEAQLKAKKRAAKENLLSDPHLENLTKKFDGKILHDTIEHLDN